MHLTIGPLSITINGLTDTEIPENSRIFIAPTGNADRQYTFQWVETLPQPDETWTMTFERPDIKVYQKGKLEARRMAVGIPDAAYALYQEENEKEATVFFLQSLKKELLIDTIFISCLALERPLVAYGGFILHSCFLNVQGQAILFSGPSGIGKSTHANLWCQYIEGSQVVNGDRCLIYKDKDQTYKACAWPVCGSSGICLKEEWPLKAIIFLGQAPQNEVVNVRPMQLFKQLSSQVTINWWNKPAVTRMLDGLQTMLNEIKMGCYVCNLTAEAPRHLYNYLKEQQWIN